MARRLLKIVIVLAAACGLGYWLFADTAAYYSADGGGQPLRFSFTGTFEEFAMWQEILDGFRREHPEIPLKGEYILENGYLDKVRQFLVAGNAPDVMVYEDERFPNRVNEGHWEDLTPYLAREKDGEDKNPHPTPPAAARAGEQENRRAGKGAGLEALTARFYPTAAESFGRWEAEGVQRRWHQYGLPIKGGCNLIFYNKECFDRAHVRVAPLPGPEGLAPDPAIPGAWIVDDQKWTIAEWVEVCKLVTLDPAHTGRPVQLAFTLPNWKYWLPFSETLGARFLDDAHARMTFYGPAAEASMQLYQDLRFKYHVAQTRSEMTMGEGIGFLTGRVAMMASGPWETPFFNDSPTLRYDVLHIPRATPGGFRATRITWDSIVMYGRSKKKDQAWVLMQYITSYAGQKVIGRSGSYIPALRQAGPDFLSANPRVHADRFLEAAGSYARMQPISSYWDLLSRVVQQAQDKVVADSDSSRLSPAKAIGMIYDDRDPDAVELSHRLPPQDPAEAARYRRLFQAEK